MARNIDAHDLLRRRSERELVDKIQDLCVGSAAQEVASALSWLLVQVVMQLDECTAEEAVDQLADRVNWHWSDERSDVRLQ